MSTSTRFAVAVHLLTNLAAAGEEPLRSEDLARSASTSASVVRSLLVRLNRAGLTQTQLGAGGGVQLKRPAKKIRLIDVYRATEETEIFARHRTEPSQRCPIGRVILDVLNPVFSRAQSALEHELASVTVQDVTEDAARLAGFKIGSYRPPI
ncbi:Rrf2 family transcriptional regulator [Paraburkholderia sp. C35]|uniref:Rrf2 family transcriptional regulator n=1 Tax=Paraburkholderia sp. C35 TaxID=2126993 RepID=UPI000D691D20|nr:Rrf2 family transcriptional regulator [Paraburkholderia sp. C35]